MVEGHILATGLSAAWGVEAWEGPALDNHPRSEASPPTWLWSPILPGLWDPASHSWSLRSCLPFYLQSVHTCGHCPWHGKQTAGWLILAASRLAWPHFRAVWWEEQPQIPDVCSPASPPRLMGSHECTETRMRIVLGMTGWPVLSPDI